MIGYQKALWSFSLVYASQFAMHYAVQTIALLSVLQHLGRASFLGNSILMLCLSLIPSIMLDRIGRLKYYSKIKIINLAHALDLIIIPLAALGIWNYSKVFLGATAFCMGVQRIIFYWFRCKILRDFVPKNELHTIQQITERADSIAGLLGILAGLMFLHTQKWSALWLVLLLIFRALSWLSNAHLFRHAPFELALAAESLPSNPQWQHLFNRKTLMYTSLATGWCYFLYAGVGILATLFVQEILQGSGDVFVLLLSVCAAGLFCGALFSRRLSKGHLQFTYVPLSTFLASIFLWQLKNMTLYFVLWSYGPPSNSLELLCSPNGWRLLLAVWGLSASAALFLLPLQHVLNLYTLSSRQIHYAFMAYQIQSFMMVLGFCLTVTLLMGLQLDISYILAIFAQANFVVALWTCRLLPQAFIKSILRTVLDLLFRVEVKGQEHFYAAGKRVLIISNHLSYLDGILCAAYLPGPCTFAVYSGFVRNPILGWILRLVDTVALDPHEVSATKILIEKIQQHRKVVIFPEGRLSMTGGVMKIYEGPGLIADKAKAQILPIRIDGAQYSVFARLAGKFKIRFFPKITLTILPPRTFFIPPHIQNRQRRQWAAAKLYDLMSDMLFESSNAKQTITEALWEASKVHGVHRVILSNGQKSAISYHTLFQRSATLGRFLVGASQKQEIIGILIPTEVNSFIAFTAIHSMGRIACWLPLPSTTQNICEQVQKLGIKSVIVTHDIALEYPELIAAGIQLIEVEQILQQSNFLTPFTTWWWLRNAKQQMPHQNALLILDEKLQRGVLYSHEQILANCWQMASRIDFAHQDVVLNTLPFWMPYSLNLGLLLPLLQGSRVVLHPVAHQYRAVCESVYLNNATVFLATNSLLQAYGQHSDPYDFYNVRYVFCAIEKATLETRLLWFNKFGLRLLEAYTPSPAHPISLLNSPLQCRPETVGKALPMVESQMFEHIGRHSGELVLRSPAFSCAYMDYTQPLLPIIQHSDWLATEDLGWLNEQGFLQLIGKKSLCFVHEGVLYSALQLEQWLENLWPQSLNQVQPYYDQAGTLKINIQTNFAHATVERWLNFLDENQPLLSNIPYYIEWNKNLFK